MSNFLDDIKRRATSRPTAAASFSASLPTRTPTTALSRVAQRRDFRPQHELLPTTIARSAYVERQLSATSPRRLAVNQTRTIGPASPGVRLNRYTDLNPDRQLSQSPLEAELPEDPGPATTSTGAEHRTVGHPEAVNRSAVDRIQTNLDANQSSSYPDVDRSVVADSVGAPPTLGLDDGTPAPAEANVTTPQPFLAEPAPAIARSTDEHIQQHTPPLPQTESRAGTNTVGRLARAESPSGPVSNRDTDGSDAHEPAPTRVESNQQDENFIIDRSDEGHPTGPYTVDRSEDHSPSWNTQPSSGSDQTIDQQTRFDVPEEAATAGETSFTHPDPHDIPTSPQQLGAPAVDRSSTQSTQDANPDPSSATQPPEQLRRPRTTTKPIPDVVIESADHNEDNRINSNTAAPLTTTPTPTTTLPPIVARTVNTSNSPTTQAEARPQNSHWQQQPTNNDSTPPVVVNRHQAQTGQPDDAAGARTEIEHEQPNDTVAPVDRATRASSNDASIDAFLHHTQTLISNSSTPPASSRPSPAIHVARSAVDAAPEADSAELEPSITESTAPTPEESDDGKADVVARKDLDRLLRHRLIQEYERKGWGRS